MTDIDVISGKAVDLAIRLHRQLGPGLLESVYETVLAGRLEVEGFSTERQRPVAFEFDGHRFDNGFRLDLFVEQCLIIEIKSVERLLPVHAKQLLTYLRLTQQPVGLLLNFGGDTMKEGIRRLVNNYRPAASSATSAPLREPDSIPSRNPKQE